MKPIYLKAYNALMSRLTDMKSGNPELVANINAGEAIVRPAVYYIRWLLGTTTAGTKPFFDNSQQRSTGITTFEKGKFPYKAAASFSHVYLGVAYSSTQLSSVALGRYSNLLYDPATTDIQTLSSVAYPVEKNRIDEDFLNAEFSFRIGPVQFFDRAPIDQFFKQARYQNDQNALGGVGSIENSYEMLHSVTCTDNHEPDLEIHWPSGASITNYTYLEFRLHGVEVATK